MISRLGRFEIQAEIGRGGFGQVFRAFDPDMNRIVAVKVLTATDDTSSFNRFKNEAAAAGNLHHENIVVVHEFGHEGKTPYIVMEYLDGEDLQHVIRNQSPMTLYQKVRVMDQVADGLQCAHQNSVLHRDVKPANVMVLRNGTAKIMDFGIARLTRDTSTRLTQQGYLIGTVVYMAPELFADYEVDALCDVWSYGVILYELLTGKNPFQTGNMQSEMYRICNQDVELIPPDVCPPDLEAVVKKLLTRQRELRYQSLEDTRLDLQPILKNLEKAEAQQLLAKAQQLLLQKTWDEAIATAREARRLDPQNGTARVIFDRAQSELQRETLRPRIDDLLGRSRDLVGQRKIQEGIDLLETARRLDSRNEKVLARIQEFRVIKQRLDEAARLVAAAGEDLHNNRLTSAFEHASNAVSLDPGHPEARGLLEKIQVEIEVRETERSAEIEIRRARGFMATDNLDDAAEALKNAEAKYPGRADTKELQSKLAQLIAERERRLDFSRRLEKAKDSVRNARHGDAVVELEQLLEAFPNEVEATNLLGYARQELNAKQRSEEIREVLDCVAKLGEEQQFEEAIGLLEDGLKRFPEDLSLTRQLRSIHGERQSLEHERALNDGLKKCEDLRQRHKWEQAMELASELRVQHPNSRELAKLEDAVRRESNEAKRAIALHEALAQAKQLLQGGQPDHASMVLESAILGLGAQRELINLLEKVHEAQHNEREQRYIQSELKHAVGFEQSGELTTSLKIIDDALLRSPDSAELQAAKDRLNQRLERAKCDQMVFAEAADVEQALKHKAWPQASAKLEEATRRFPAEDVFSRLQEELQRRKRDDLCEKLAEARRLLNSGKVQEAEAFVSVHLLNHREDPQVMALGRDIVAEKRRLERVREEEEQKAAFVATCLSAAQSFERAGDFPAALSSVEKVLERYPKHPELVSRQQRLSDQIASARRRLLIDRINEALERTNWPQALEMLEQARREYPTDPVLIPLRARALEQQRVFLKGAADAIRSKIAESKLHDAQTLFDENLLGHTDHEVVRGVVEEIAGAKARFAAAQKSAEARREFIDAIMKRVSEYAERGDLPDAVSIVQKALKKYNGDPDLTCALNQLQSGIEQKERERSLAAAINAIRRDFRRAKWGDALKRTAEALKAHPDDPQLISLEHQAREERDREIQAMINSAEASLKAGNLTGAEKILTGSLAPFAGESAVTAFALRLAEARLRDDLVRKARNSTASGHFEEAEATVNELAARHPNDPVEVSLRLALKAARERKRKEDLYATGRADGDQLLRRRQYSEAIARFEYLLTQFPADNQLQEDLAGAIAAEKRSRELNSRASAAAAGSSSVRVPSGENHPVTSRDLEVVDGRSAGMEATQGETDGSASTDEAVKVDRLSRPRWLLPAALATGLVFCLAWVPSYILRMWRVPDLAISYSAPVPPVIVGSSTEKSPQPSPVKKQDPTPKVQPAETKPSLPIVSPPRELVVPSAAVQSEPVPAAIIVPAKNVAAAPPCEPPPPDKNPAMVPKKGTLTWSNTQGKGQVTICGKRAFVLRDGTWTESGSLHGQLPGGVPVTVSGNAVVLTPPSKSDNWSRFTFETDETRRIQFSWSQQ